MRYLKAIGRGFAKGYHTARAFYFSRVTSGNRVASFVYRYHPEIIAGLLLLMLLRVLL
jgi:hypothetical protein